jgi:5-methylcytosine-specific restriction endonuclease McrA
MILLDMQSSWEINAKQLRLLGVEPLNMHGYYRDYAKRYMRSKRWKETRNRILLTTGGCCARCGVNRDRYKVDVHHLTYARLGAELDADLMPLCYRCHGTVHYVRNMRQDKAQ